MKPNVSEAILDAVRAAAHERDDKQFIACRTALALAADLGVPPGQVGQACNELHVRIEGCQLGCFK